jgi:hypothetical protein
LLLTSEVIVCFRSTPISPLRVVCTVWQAAIAASSVTASAARNRFIAFPLMS